MGAWVEVGVRRSVPTPPRGAAVIPLQMDSVVFPSRLSALSHLFFLKTRVSVALLGTTYALAFMAGGSI